MGGTVTEASIFAGPQGRRADLDWIRVAAFGLLILYHVGMVFVTWDYHVKTAHPGDTIEPLMLLLNPWRLSLLFFVSGCATRFMAVRMAPGALARMRLTRLGVPLLVAMYFIVPPQSWVQVQEHGFHVGFWAFFAQYLTGYHGYCDAKGCLLLPTWNHLWFVAYLLAYTMLLAGISAAAPRFLAWIGARLAPAFKGIGVLVWPAVWLVLLRETLAPSFPETHAFVGDWYAHSVYASLFLAGFALAGGAQVWDRLTRLRWVALPAAILCYASVAIYFNAYSGDIDPPDWLRRVMRAVYGVNQWMWIAAILGFAHLHLRRGGPVLDYLTQGVFPFYIAHQTIIVLVEFWIKPYGLPQPAEGAILILSTACGCLITYEVVRRVGWLRPLFGLRPDHTANFSWPFVSNKRGFSSVSSG